MPIQIGLSERDTSPLLNFLRNGIAAFGDSVSLEEMDTAIRDKDLGFSRSRENYKQVKLRAIFIHSNYENGFA